MDCMTREVPFSLSDFDLFGQDISPSDYEFFKKHTGAFKRMLLDESKEKKQEFVDAFKEFSLRHGCLKDCSGKNDGRFVFIDEAAIFYKVNFVHGKVSTAKNIVMDAVILAQNKHLLQNMGAKSYSKDPFFHKETRDVFRRLFGPPSENVTFMKVICILPLHIKFGGSLCRYLRRWLEAEPIKTLPPQPSKLPKTTPKKKEKELKERIFSHEDGFSRCTCDMHHRFAEIPGLSGVRAVLETTDFSVFGKSDRKREHPEEKPTKKETMKEKGPEDTKTILKSAEKAASKSSQSIPKKTIPDEEKKSSTSTKDDEKKKTPSSIKDEELRKNSSSKQEEKKNNSSTSSLNEEKKNKFGSSLSEEKKKKQKSSSVLKDEVFKVSNEKLSDDLTGDSSIDADDSLDEIREMMMLNTPHPNEQFEQLLGKPLSEEHEKKLKKCKETAGRMQLKHLQGQFDRLLKEGEELEAQAEILKEIDNICRVEEEKKKRHACANCRKVEPEPKKFKKCQRCRGKRTRFYCSRSCQEKDWASHREDHNSIEDVT